MLLEDFVVKSKLRDVLQALEELDLISRCLGIFDSFALYINSAARPPKPRVVYSRYNVSVLTLPESAVVPVTGGVEMASLGPAVSSLRSSLTLLESSISILDEGVSDFPRLCKVLQTQQHFELLPEPTLREAQQSLVDEIVPAINQLLSIAESHVNQLARREESLKARSELLEGRLNSNRRRSSFAGGAQPFQNKKPIQSGGLADSRLVEMKRLQQKKERLQYAIERLELQSRQRERELRKSMAME